MPFYAYHFGMQQLVLFRDNGDPMRLLSDGETDRLLKALRNLPW